MRKQTKAWLKRIAKANQVTQEEVLTYLRELSHSKKVIHHLDLAATPPEK